MTFKERILDILFFIATYLVEILIAIDRLVNAILVGDSKHTISGRTGFAAYRGKTWGIYFAKFIDTLFFFDENHCHNAMMNDQKGHGYSLKESYAQRTRRIRRKKIKGE